MEQQNKCPKEYKILVVGDDFVGKTTLIQRFIKGHQARHQCFPVTCSPQLHVKNVTVYNTRVILNIWDTPGTPRLRITTRKLYRGCDAVVLVFDSSNINSFAKLSFWIHEIRSYSKPVVTFLVGNKVDLDRKVSFTEAVELADKNNFDDYSEISVLTGENVDNLFMDIAETLLINEKEDNLTRRTFKLIFVGDASVGKTSIIKRHMQGFHPANGHSATIAPEVNFKCTTAHNVRVRLNIWDTVGAEKFRSMTRSYYRNCHAVVCVYDASNQESFYNLSWWMNELQKHSDPVIKYLIGNKIDLVKQVNSTEAAEFAENNSFSYFMETSAVTGKHIDDVFLDIAERLVEKMRQGLIPDAEDQGEEDIIKLSKYDVPQMNSWWMTCFSWVASIFRKTPKH